MRLTSVCYGRVGALVYGLTNLVAVGVSRIADLAEYGCKAAIRSLEVSYLVAAHLGTIRGDS